MRSRRVELRGLTTSDSQGSSVEQDEEIERLECGRESGVREKSRLGEQTFDARS
jgi:hypothetical protein